MPREFRKGFHIKVDSGVTLDDLVSYPGNVIKVDSVKNACAELKIPEKTPHCKYCKHCVGKEQGKLWACSQKVGDKVLVTEDRMGSSACDDFEDRLNPRKETLDEILGLE